MYFLVGPDSGPGTGTQVYIGETDDAAQRLTVHSRPEDKGGKDFWEKVCVVTSKDANLTKGHIKYLESRLIRIAQQAGRCELLNGTDPGYENLPEADRSDMEFFVEQIQTLLPVLGFDFMRATPSVSTTPGLSATGLAPLTRDPTKARIETDLESPVFSGDVRKYDIRAKGSGTQWRVRCVQRLFGSPFLGRRDMWLHPLVSPASGVRCTQTLGRQPAS